MSTNGVVKGKLFEYAVLYHPKQTKEQADRNENPKSVLVTKPTQVLAGSDAEVSILAARGIPPEHLEHLEDVEIAVRPFKDPR
jgi:hypothetical protein